MDRTRTRSVGDNGLRFLLVLSLAVVGMVGVVSLPALAMEGAASTDERPADERPTDERPAAWGVEQIHAPTVWDEHGTRGEGVRVAVLDSGIDADHPELDIVGWGDWDSDGNPRDTDPRDYDVQREPSGHGTHVAGIVAGGGASGTHVGVAPDAELLVGAVLTDCGPDGCDARAAQIIAGIEWAVENEADIIVVSAGLVTKDEAFIEPIRNAHDAGTLVVASGGNYGLGTSTAPGNDYDSISVGASDPNGTILDLSGGEVVFTDLEWTDPPEEWPDAYVLPTVAAPGWEIPSTVVGGQYARGTGTSQAAPHVAGGAALVQSATEERLTPEEINGLLVETAAKPDGLSPDQDVRYGHGIINVAAAVEFAVDGTTRTKAEIGAFEPGEQPPERWEFDATLQDGGSEGSEPNRGDGSTADDGEPGTAGDDTEPTDDASVGFGIGGAVLALAVVGYLASRVTRV